MLEDPVAEGMFRSLAERVSTIVLKLDRDGLIRYINRPPPGVDIVSVLGASIYAFISAEYRAPVSVHVQTVCETGTPCRFETKGTGPHGTEAHYLSDIWPVFGAHLDIVEAAISMLDISARDEAEYTRERMASIVRSSSDGVIGGDEFVVVVEGVSAASEAEGMAAKLVAAVGAPHHVSGHTVAIEVSVGIALSSED